MCGHGRSWSNTILGGHFYSRVSFSSSTFLANELFYYFIFLLGFSALQPGEALRLSFLFHDALNYSFSLTALISLCMRGYVYVFLCTHVLTGIYVYTYV